MKFLAGIFEEWFAHRKSRPYGERLLSKRFWDRLISWDGKQSSLLKIADCYSVGQLHDGACKEEKCAIKRSVEDTLRRLLCIVNIIDRRLVFELVAVGSAVDGSKLFLPDEFDFLAVCRLSQLMDDHDDAATIRTKIDHKVYMKLVLSEAIREAISRGLPFDSRLKFQFAECIKLADKICYKMAFTWQGKTYKRLGISVDLSPVERHRLSSVNDGLFAPEYFGPWSRLAGQVDEYFTTTDSKSDVTIPTIESQILNSSPALQCCYRFLKLLVLSYSINDEVHRGTYVVKTALLNYSRDHPLAPAGKRTNVIAYAMEVLKRVLVRLPDLPRFGIAPRWNYRVENWCHAAHQSARFPDYPTLIFGSRQQYAKRSASKRRSHGRSLRRPVKPSVKKRKFTTNYSSFFVRL